MLTVLCRIGSELIRRSKSASFSVNEPTYWFDLPVEESFDLLRHIYHVPVSRCHENLDLFNQILGLDEFFRTPVRQY